MPDHMHLLLEGLANQSDLRRFMRIAKQRSAYQYSREGKGRLWQEGYHDRVVRPEDDVLLYAQYLLQNPVRAGLVEDVSRYKHAGSDVWPVSEILAVRGADL
jgi:REP element-mobilizing transposase RayT